LIYLLDADLGGTESVQDLIDQGLVQYIPIPTFEAFDKAVEELKARVSDADTIIVDPISTLGNTTRGDFRLGTEDGEVWNKRNLYFGGDKNFLTQYEAAEKMINDITSKIKEKGSLLGKVKDIFNKDL